MLSSCPVLTERAGRWPKHWPLLCCTKPSVASLSYTPRHTHTHTSTHILILSLYETFVHWWSFLLFLCLSVCLCSSSHSVHFISPFMCPICGDFRGFTCIQSAREPAKHTVSKPASHAILQLVSHLASQPVSPVPDQSPNGPG